MTNVAVIAAILIAALLSASVTEQMAPSPSSGPSVEPDCMTNLLNMTDCLSYVQVGNRGGAANPDKSCCPELAGLVDNSPQCLCYLLGGDMEVQYGIKIDKAKALKLPEFVASLLQIPHYVHCLEFQLEHRKLWATRNPPQPSLQLQVLNHQKA
ncbi:Bifunctional inhibitor/plant lipid transfer protein/seed storage helical domain protein [Raphanus sativus]|nr:Bifunctional inhibitor/plant lipid transfer protein/seed storage helical domain protein [Raphanus sativus]